MMGGCLLLDFSLPGVSGLGALKLMATSGSRVPVIVMTACADEEIGPRAMDAGAAGFVTKPFQSDQLMLVKGALARPVVPPDRILARNMAGRILDAGQECGAPAEFQVPAD